jgi:RNA polymerase sigma factor (sigma-70 family)
MIGLFMTQPTSTRERAAVSLVAQETAELRPLIRAVIASMLHESREHPDVEDCTHEVLRRALEGSTRLRDGEPLRPWVTGIARHVALDALRSRKRHRLRSAVNDSEPEDGGPSTLDRVADDAPSPHDRVAAAEQARAVRVALDRLPEGQREALRLFHLEELGYPEIARRLDVPLGTVATWISRARKAMAENIAPERSAL